MRIVSWNVNGLRSRLQSGFFNVTEDLRPDILLLQEIRCREQDLKLLEKSWESKDIFINESKRVGYSGVCVCSYPDVNRVIYGIKDDLDFEGRVLTSISKDLAIVNIYAPNCGRDYERSKERATWDEHLLNFIKELMKDYYVIVMGDFNVVHYPIDYYLSEGKVLVKKEPSNEKKTLNKLVEMGFTDAFRKIYPEKREYTYWSNFGKSSDLNKGWRIDYSFVDNRIFHLVQDCKMFRDRVGSDHCPIILDIDYQPW
jgi:exodeoxyribonuclease-3